MKGFGAATTAATPLSEAERRWVLLGVSELRDRLTAGADLPKDMFVDTTVANIYQNPYRRRDRNYERSVLHALLSAGATTTDETLAISVANCRRGTRCRRSFCFVCTQRHWRRRRRLLLSLEEPFPNERISWCTVIIGQSQEGYVSLIPMIEAFKRAFTTAAGRQVSTAWFGRVEIDYLDPGISTPQPQKMPTLVGLGWDPLSEMPTLIPHVHLIVAHPDVTRGALAQQLKWTFPGSRRVQMKPLRITRTRSDSLDSLARYPLKPPLERAFLAGKNSKNHVPRNPAAVRYVVRMHEQFEQEGHRGLMEFDYASPRYWPPA